VIRANSNCLRCERDRRGENSTAEIPKVGGAALCREIRSERHSSHKAAPTTIACVSKFPLAHARSYDFVIAGLIWVALAVSASAAEPVGITGRAMGTSWSVKLIQPSTPVELAIVQRRVANRLEELERQFSTYRADSTISRFNAAQHTDWFAVEPELAQVAILSRAVSALTNGAFDVTVYPLITLWGFGGSGTQRADSLPSHAEIVTARRRVDWRQLEVKAQPPALRKTAPRVEVDFSSMAKGFAADAISEELTQLGAPNHLVQIGGDMKSGGAAVDGRGWCTGIEAPTAGTQTMARVIALHGEALSTSGDYRNFVELGGQRYGHIIDPRTGFPVSGALASVSVVHSSAAMSSALATALFVLGPEAGFRLAQEQKLACLFQVREGSDLLQRATPVFERQVKRGASGEPPSRR
jgi:FAD:protein FMN transferase